MNNIRTLSEVEINEICKSKLSLKEFKEKYPEITKIRISKVNGTPLMGTRDFRLDRLNVTLVLPENEVGNLSTSRFDLGVIEELSWG